MKVKARPADFRVVEQLDLGSFSSSPAPYSVYKLEKSGLSTLEVVQMLTRRHHIPDRAIQYAGMKDKYAQTTQYLSIYRFDREAIRERSFDLTRIGYSQRPVSPDLLTGNRFTVTLRDIAPNESDALVSHLRQVAESGIPNYFDEQRFGSARHGRGWIARALMLGEFEAALKMALATPAHEDRSRDKATKKFIQAHWGRWAECLKQVSRNPERSILSYLAALPDDFTGAVNRLPPRLLSIYLSAYQSFLWNEIAAAYLQSRLPPDRLLTWPYSHGTFVFFTTLSESDRARFRDQALPLLGHRTEIENSELRALVEGLLRGEGLSLPDFKLSKVKSAFLKSSERAFLVEPRDFSFDAPAPDDAYPGKLACTLRFSLPPGCYATILIKRLQAGVGH